MSKIHYFIISVAIVMSPAKGQAELKSANVQRSLLAAIETKKSAAVQIEKLLQKTQGTPRYIPSVEKLAAIYFDTAQLQGEVSALGKSSNGGIQQSSPAAPLFSKVIQYTTLVLSHSNDHNLPTKMLLLRGQSYKEMGKWQESTSDFKKVVQINPKSQDALTAAFVAYDTLLDRNDLESAKLMIERLGLQPGHSHYLLGTEYLANIYFKMGSYAKAISLVETVLKGTESAQSSKNAIHRKSAFALAAQIFSTSIEKNDPGYDLKSALKFFKTYAKASETSKLISDFSLQLRIRNQSIALEGLALSLDELSLPNTTLLTAKILVELVILEFYLKKERSYLEKSLARMSDTLTKAAKLSPDERIDPKVYVQAQAFLTQTITAQRNQPSPSFELLSKLYECLLIVPDENKVNALSYHLDLAQIYEKTQSYNQAAKHFRWIATNRDLIKKLDAQKMTLASQSSLRAIVSKYQAFKTEKKVPSNLTIASLEEGKTSDLTPEQKEWMEWVDSEPRQDDSNELQTMIYEKNRILYQLGHRESAIKGLTQFIKTYPTSPYTIPALMLVVDTYMVSKRWESTVQTTQSSLKSQIPFTPEIRTSLENTGALAYFRWLEAKFKKEEFKSVVKGSDQALKDFPNSKYKNDLLAIAGHAALKQNDRKLAKTYFSQLDRKTSKPEYLQTAYLTEAADAEEKLSFSDSATSYLSYIKLKPDEDIRKKILLFSWISGKASELYSVLKVPEICAGSAKAEDCEQYNALLQLMLASDSPGALKQEEKISRWKQSPKDLQVIWATAVLDKSDKLNWEDRLIAIKQVLTKLDKTDPLIRVFLLSYLSESFPRSLNDARKILPKLAPVKISKKAISKRVEMLKTFEDVLQSSDKSDWTHLRHQSLSIAAAIYRDLALELKSLPAPKGLTQSDLEAYKNSLQDLSMPFESKSMEYITAVFQSSNENGADAKLIDQIAPSYFEIKPDLAKDLQLNWVVFNYPEIVPSLFALDLKVWKDQTDFWQVWRQAITEKNLQKVGYLLLIAKSQNKLSESSIKLAEGIAIAQAGASAEALKILSQSIEEGEKPLSREVCNLLIFNSYRSYAKELTQSRLKTCEQNKSNLKPDLMNTISAWLNPSIKKDKAHE